MNHLVPSTGSSPCQIVARLIYGQPESGDGGGNLPDVSSTVLILLVAGLWGAIGGVIYWATPDRPEGTIQFLKRISVGWVAGAVTNALGGVSPFDSNGAWDAAGIGRLIVAGFVGLSAIATFLPEKLNETYRKQIAKMERPGGA